MVVFYCLYSFFRMCGEFDEKFMLVWLFYYLDMYFFLGLRFVMKDWFSVFWFYLYCDGYFVYSVEFFIVCK